uniref:Uncharacterized protein n=1 Tax=Tetradesmus obliquus TaxID=3088 RepID=A0A383V3B0_TETOB|eukprot:jgi/Sobl393_1/290/SZX60078.1
MCRCISEAKERRLQLKLQRYRLQSDIAALQRDLKQMKAKLDSEQQQQQQLTRQLKQLQHARAARASSTQWHLSSVQLYHNKVVQAAPVTLEAELASLQQQQRVSQLEAKTLQAGIQSREGRLKMHTRQLAALQG